MQYHAAAQSKSGSILILCGARGQVVKAGANLNSTVSTREFASLMFSGEAESCCAHCKNSMRKMFPKTVARAAA